MNVKKWIKNSFAISGIGLSFLLAGCSEKPLDSLKKNKLSENYPMAFWDKEQKVKSDLWKQAVQICLDPQYKSLPNCGAIHTIQFFDIPPPHKYGTGQGFGKDNMPQLSH